MRAHYYFLRMNFELPQILPLVSAMVSDSNLQWPLAEAEICALQFRLACCQTLKQSLT
jgi:hypothetical protein